MELPSLSCIIHRTLIIIVRIVALVFAHGWFTRHQRSGQIARELTVLTTDSQFFRQFYAEDVRRKTLTRAVSLLFEAESLGMPPDETIDKAPGIKQPLFENELRKEQADPREVIIRGCLRSNYDHLLKLEFTPEPRSILTA